MQKKEIELHAFFLFLFSTYAFGEEIEIKKEYWGEGKLKSEKHYKDGKISGFITIWHKNGYKKVKKLYVDGKENGVATSWSEDGNKVIEKKFLNGIEQ